MNFSKILTEEVQRQTYNSTKPGFPWPITVSKLLGSRSITLEALTPANRPAKRMDNDNLMKGTRNVEVRRGAPGRLYLYFIA